MNKTGDTVIIGNQQIEIIISEKEIQERIDELAFQINKDYLEKEVVIVSILTGSMFFTVDLAKRLSFDLNLSITSMDVESYGNDTKTSGTFTIYKDLNINIENKDVLIVEDIIDTGLTMAHIVELLKLRSPNSIRICCLLNKPSRRGKIPKNFTDHDTMQKISEISDMLKEGYIGFKINDTFVVGYGLDFEKKLRHLPFIGKIIK